MTTATKTRAPSHLSKEAQEWWKRVQTEYGIDDEAGLWLLQTAAEAWERMNQARSRLAVEGLTFKDTRGKPRVHPLCAVERDSRAQLIQALKALNLDLMPMRDKPGRPPGK